MPARGDEDRLFVRDGWRHYRRTYSRAEFRWGFAVLAVLVAIVGWVVYRGGNPDPSLYAAAEPQASDSAGADRGPVPEGLARPGWSEGPISQFDEDNLYVKINGRADYFFSFGFERLYFVPLQHDEGATVDVEVYDLGTPANALGAFSGERKDGEPERSAGGMAYVGRNALFATRGQYYVRAIGSDETELIKQQLGHVRAVLEAEMAGGELPGAYGLFASLGIDADAVEYHRENAFSFGFANDVYVANVDDDVQLFAVELGDPEAAGALAARFSEAFVKYGSDAGDGWAEDRYLSTFHKAVAAGGAVVGVRGAPDLERGEAELARLRSAIQGGDVVER